MVSVRTGEGQGYADREDGAEELKASIVGKDLTRRG